MMQTIFGPRERVLAPPQLKEGEHVLWETKNKRLTFWVRGDDAFTLTIYTRLDAVGQDEPSLTKDEVRRIIGDISRLAQL